MRAHSALTVNEELGSLQLAGNTPWSLPAHHGLPILPGPGDLWHGRSLDTAQQVHTLPNPDLHVAQGLRKVRSSWRREQQRRSSGRSSILASPQLSLEKEQGCKTSEPGALTAHKIDLKHLVLFQSCQRRRSFHPFQLHSSPPGSIKPLALFLSNCFKPFCPQHGAFPPPHSLSPLLPPVESPERLDFQAHRNQPPPLPNPTDCTLHPQLHPKPSCPRAMTAALSFPAC